MRADPEALIEALKGSAGVLDLTAVRADTLRIDDHAEKGAREILSPS